MKITRTIAIAAAGTMLTAAVGTAPVAAQAADGAGTATAGGSILAVDIGDILGVTLLGDDGLTSNDVAGTVKSSNVFNVLSTRSSLLAAIDGESFGSYSTSATNGEDTASEAFLDLADYAPPLPPGVVSGALAPTELVSSLVGSNGSSTVDAALVDFGLFGSLVSVDSVQNTLSALTSTTSTSADRTATIDALSVLDVAGLLNLLTIDLLDLDLPVVGDLLAAQGLEVPTTGFPAVADVTDGASLDTLVSTVDTVITALADPIADMVATIGSVGCTLTDIIDPILGGLLGGFVGGDTVGDVLGALNAALAPLDITVSCDLDAVNGLVDLIHTTLVGILGDVADAVGSGSLLDVQGLTASVSAVATDAVATSSASATGSIDDFTVAGVTIPGVRVEDTIATLDATVESITSAIDGALAPLTALVGAGETIGDVLTIDLFEPTEASVHEVDGLIESVAGITVLSVGVRPPAILGDLLAQVAAIAPADTLGAAITDAGGSLPVLSDLTSQITGATGAAEALGTDGVQVEVLGMANTANHRAAAASSTVTGNPSTGGEDLATTGGDTAPAVILAALVALGFVVVRRRFATR